MRFGNLLTYLLTYSYCTAGDGALTTREIETATQSDEGDHCTHIYNNRARRPQTVVRRSRRPCVTAAIAASAMAHGLWLCFALFCGARATSALRSAMFCVAAEPSRRCGHMQCAQLYGQNGLRIIHLMTSIPDTTRRVRSCQIRGTRAMRSFFGGEAAFFSASSSFAKKASRLG